MGGVGSCLPSFLPSFSCLPAGAAAADIIRDSTFIETSSMPNTGELWTGINNPSQHLLLCSVCDCCGSWRNETVSFSIRRGSVQRGWWRWETHETLFLQLLVAFHRWRRLSLPHHASLHRGSRRVWVGVWDSDRRVWNRDSHLFLWHSSLPPQARFWQPPHTSGASPRCCCPQLQCRCTVWWRKWAALRDLWEGETEPCPHQYSSVS